MKFGHGVVFPFLTCRIFVTLKSSDDMFFIEEFFIFDDKNKAKNVEWLNLFILLTPLNRNTLFHNDILNGLMTLVRQKRTIYKFSFVCFNSYLPPALPIRNQHSKFPLR